MTKIDPRDIKQKINEGWLRANLIIEILGKPADYISKVMKAGIDKIDKEKNLILLNYKIHEAKPVEKVFTCFCELDILFEKMAKILEIIFDYMPSSVEIVEPATIKLEIQDANVLLNDLAVKLHQYDALTKKLNLERQVLIRKLKDIGAIKTERKKVKEVKPEEKKEENKK